MNFLSVVIVLYMLIPLTEHRDLTSFLSKNQENISKIQARLWCPIGILEFVELPTKTNYAVVKI